MFCPNPLAAKCLKIFEGSKSKEILLLELLLFLSADYRSSIGGRENTKKALYSSFLSFSPSLSALFVLKSLLLSMKTLLFIKII